MTLKTYLLATNYFIDNSFLDDYVELIESYKSKKVNGYSEKHHILQRSYFKMLQLPVDNSEKNIIVLSYKDHCKAHWLLYNCTKPPLKQANEYAISYISTMYTKLTDNNTLVFNETDLSELQTYMTAIKEDKDSRYFSTNEEQLIIGLKQKYPYGYSKKVAEIIHKPADRIQAKAYTLGISNKAPNWTETEIDILKKYYKIEGLKVVVRLPNRTKAAIRAEAQKLNLQAVSHYWQDNEIEILLKYYTELGPLKISKLIANRTPLQCRKKANSLGLNYKQEHSWTAEKIEVLKNNINLNINELIKLTGMKKSTIYMKIKELNLKEH